MQKYFTGLMLSLSLLGIQVHTRHIETNLTRQKVHRSEHTIPNAKKILFTRWSLNKNRVIYALKCNDRFQGGIILFDQGIEKRFDPHNVEALYKQFEKQQHKIRLQDPFFFHDRADLIRILGKSAQSQSLGSCISSLTPYNKHLLF